MQQQIEQTINEIFDLYQKYGNEDYISEPVSQLGMTLSFELCEQLINKRQRFNQTLG